MQKVITRIFIISVILSLNVLHAQNKVFEPEGSLSIDIGIPTQGENESFGRVMNGLFNGGINYQHNVFKGLTIGAGLKYSFFVINPFALNNAEWGGGLHIPGVYGKIGYEKFITERFSVNASIRMGYAMMVSANDSCKAILNGPYTEGSFFAEPQIELLFLTDKGASGGFSLVVGYNGLSSNFGPRFLCLDKIPNLFVEDYDGNTRFLTFGFGYRYYLGRD